MTTCRYCGRVIVPTKFNTWQDQDSFEVCDLTDEAGTGHKPDHPFRSDEWNEIDEETAAIVDSISHGFE